MAAAAVLMIGFFAGHGWESRQAFHVNAHCKRRQMRAQSAWGWGQWLALGVLSASLASAKARASLPQPVDVIPRVQPPLQTIFRPGPGEDSLKAKEKVILLSREDVGGPGTWDFLACAWEFLPSQPQKPMTKRVVFEHSGSSPDFLPFIEPHQADEYLELAQHSSMNLYRVNFRNWDVAVILTNTWVRDYAMGGQNIYLWTTDQVLRLQRPTSAIQAEPRFEYEGDFNTRYDASWLVHLDGTPPTEMRMFEPAANQFGPKLHFGDATQARWWHYQLTLSPNHNYLAYVRMPDPQPHDHPGIITTRVLVHDLKTDAVREYPSAVYVEFVRGVGLFRPPHFRLWFPSPDTLKFQSGIPTLLGFQKITETTIDLTSGRRDENIVGDLHPEPDKLAGYFVPAYLGQVHIRMDPEQDLALAFLKHKEVSFTAPEVWDAVKVAFAADKKRFLLKWWQGPNCSRFFMGDLEHDTLKIIPSPPELENDNALNLRWVTVGE